MRQIRYTSMTAEKKSYIWLTTEEQPKFYAILISKNVIFELLSKFVTLENNFTVGVANQIIGLYSLIFIGIAISVVRPAIFGNTLKITMEELPRSEILQIFLDAMHFARIEKDLLLEDMLYQRLIDIMRDYDLLSQVTDSTLLQREKNINDRFKSLKGR